MVRIFTLGSNYKIHVQINIFYVYSLISKYLNFLVFSVLMKSLNRAYLAAMCIELNFSVLETYFNMIFKDTIPSPPMKLLPHFSSNTNGRIRIETNIMRITMLMQLSFIKKEIEDTHLVYECY